MQEMEPILTEINPLNTFTEGISEFDSQWQNNSPKVIGQIDCIYRKVFPLQENFNQSCITISHKYVLTSGKREGDIFLRVC